MRPALAAEERPFLSYPGSPVMCLSMLLLVLLLPNFSSAQLRDRTEHQRVDQGQQAQKQDKKNKGGPRAIAVVEFLPGGGTRLVPIALWINDRFYDASLYGADPEPMALEPETLYQALTYGEPAGWFTVTTPKDVNGNWVADGQWKPETPLENQDRSAGRRSSRSPSLSRWTCSAMTRVRRCCGGPEQATRLRRAAGREAHRLPLREGIRPLPPAGVQLQPAMLRRSRTTIPTVQH